jgi:hypothetical protein
VGRAEVKLSQLRLEAALAVPGGKLVPGVANRIHVLAATVDGRPVRDGRVQLLRAGSSTALAAAPTDRLGTATFTITPRPDPGCRHRARLLRAPGAALVEVQVEDRLGNSRRLTRCVPLARHGLQVRPRWSFVGASERLCVEVRDPGARDGEPAYLDLLKDGQTLATLTQRFEGGAAHFCHEPADKQLSGLLAVRGYRLEGGRERVGRTRAVYVEPRSRLLIEASLDRAGTYRPGETAHLRLQVRDSASGKGVQAALGLRAVDAAVLALARQGHREDAALYFSLAGYARQQLDALRLRPAGRDLDSWLGQLPAGAAAVALRRRAAEVLLSVLEPPERPVWETDPWEARRRRWEEQSRALVDAAREAVGQLLVGQRTAGGWRFHPRLVALLVRAGKVPRRYLRDPWQRAIRPAQLQAIDSTLSFSTLAAEAAAEKLERIYDLLGANRRRLGLRRERVPALRRSEWPLQIPADFRARLRRLPRVKAMDLVDPWGQPYRRRSYDGVYIEAYDNPDLLSRHEIYSPGPDGKAGTVDDIVPPGTRRLAPLDREEAYGRGYGRLGARRARAPRVMCGRAMVRGGAVRSNRPERGAVRPRTRFPETLLWKPEVITDRQGRASVPIPLADSITTWKVRATASTVGGLFGRAGLDLRVFQPFFIHVDLPRTLTAGDRLGLPVTVYNYLKRPQTVTLELAPGSWFSTRGPLKHTVTLGPSEVRVRHFPVRVHGLGSQALTVRARAADSSGRTVADAVQRETRVLPDGTEHAITLAGLLRKPVRHRLQIPPGAIASTARVGLSVHPGPVSQTLEGLEGLLRMPGGCFEQTSSTLYPNVLILDYLRGTRRATPAVEQRARRFIDAGYQRLLTFEVAGGGFSWFGRKPANQVLTAYGLMEFSDIARVRKVDRHLIARTRRWLVQRQQQDGSWAPDKQYYLDGVVNNLTRDRLRITAYIAHALAYSGARGPALRRAVAYVLGRWQQTTDPYTLALVASLLTRVPRIAGVAAARRQALERLWSGRRVDRHGISFTGPGATLTHGGGKAGDMETTALAALAMMRADHRPHELPKVIRAIVARKDRFGAWYSTQATILALRALLAQQRRRVPPSGTLQVLVDGKARASLHLDGRDQARHLDLTAHAGGGAEIELRFAGRGSAQYRLVGSYWLPHAGRQRQVPRGGLAIDTTVDRASLRRGGAVKLRVRVRNRGGASVAMPLVSVALPPGFALDPDELARLVERFANVDRASRRGSRAVLYLSKLGPGKALDFTLRLHSQFPLRVQARPSLVYEYYRPENRASSRPLTLQVL